MNDQTQMKEFETMRSEREFEIIRKWEGPAAEAKARSEAGKSHDSASAPLPAVSDLQGLWKLLELVTDTATVKANVKAILDACTTRMGEAEKAVEASKLELAGHDQAKAAHDSKLRAEQAEHDSKCAAERAEIADLQAEAKRLNDQARVDATAAAKLKKDLEARLAILRQAGM